MASDELRIGDRERDEAVSYLREHHSTGRLDTLEFDDRMSKALEARTRRELDQLFLDLPYPKPSSGSTVANPYAVYGPEPVYDIAPAPMPSPSDNRPIQVHPATPWYAQWWMILVAVMLNAVTDVWFFIPAMAIWLWFIYPSMVRPRQLNAAAQQPYQPRQLTFVERDSLMLDVRAGRKVHAVKRYREMTGADLRTAKYAIDAMGREIGY